MSDLKSSFENACMTVEAKDALGAYKGIADRNLVVILKLAEVFNILAQAGEFNEFMFILQAKPVKVTKKDADGSSASAGDAGDASDAGDNVQETGDVLVTGLTSPSSCEAWQFILQRTAASLSPSELVGNPVPFSETEDNAQAANSDEGGKPSKTGMVN